MPRSLSTWRTREMGGGGGRGVAGAPVGTVQVDLPKFQNPTNQQTGCKQTSLGKPKFENEILQYL